MNDVLAVIPATIAALAAWRAARQTVAQTNGALHEPLADIKANVQSLAADVRDVKADVRDLKRRGL